MNLFTEFKYRFVFLLGLSLMYILNSAASSNLDQDRCAKLASLSLPHTVITQAESISAGNYLAPDRKNYTVPAFCKVHGVSVPTKGSHINFEVWLPIDTWNGRFYQLGTGGFSGLLDEVSGKLVESINRGNAVAMTDGGHDLKNPAWALHQPEKIIDMGYRALKETSSSARQLIGVFYNRKPAYSYYAGCSGGGRDAMVAATRFPEDWDGVLVGAPGTDIIRTWTNFAWVDKALNINKSSQIPVAKLPAIQKAALASCTADAHVVEGIAADTRFCRLDTSELICKDQENDNCLTEPQATALAKIYDGVRNSPTAAFIYPGYEATLEAEAGDTMGWDGRFMKKETPWNENDNGKGAKWSNFFRTMVFDDLEWDQRTFDFDKDINTAINKNISGEILSEVLGPVELDFSAMQARGSKIIGYHGWGDAALSAKGGIEDYERVAQQLGGIDKIQAFYRQFMVPGMLHCSAGPGAHSFGQIHIANRLPALKPDASHDISIALEQWVEEGIAPKKIIAVKYINDNVEKGVAFTRPLCPYPQVPVYKGRGDTAKASNFECRVGKHP